MGELLMGSPPIPPVLGQRPSKEGQSPPQDIEVRPCSGLHLLVQYIVTEIYPGRDAWHIPGAMVGAAPGG